MENYNRNNYHRSRKRDSGRWKSFASYIDILRFRYIPCTRRTANASNSLWCGRSAAPPNSPICDKSIGQSCLVIARWYIATPDTDSSLYSVLVLLLGTEDSPSFRDNNAESRLPAKTIESFDEMYRIDLTPEERKKNTYEHSTTNFGSRIILVQHQFVQRERKQSGHISYGHLHRIVSERRSSIVGQRTELREIQRCVCVDETNVCRVVECRMVKVIGVGWRLAGWVQNNGGECGIVSEERLGGGGRKIVGCCVECVDFKGKVAVVFIQKGDEFHGLKQH